MDGALLDIAPLGNEDARVGIHIIGHVGDEGTFRAMKEVTVFIGCLNRQLDADDALFPEIADDHYE